MTSPIDKLPEKNRNLALRIISALVMVPIITYLVYLGGYWSSFIYAVGASACVYEYYAITIGQRRLPEIAGVAAAFAMPFFPVALPHDAGDLCFWWIVGCFVCFFAWHLIWDPSKEAPIKIGHLTTGLVYGSSGMVALAFIGKRPFGSWWTFLALCITWMNDTWAYFVGRAFGRHKLYKEVSPNKSWEGFFGGMFGSTLTLFVIRAYFFKELGIVDCVVLGIGSGILGPVGDLCESMLKRSYGVKDSGRTIPGHGGMLDRLDAALFNAFFVFCYLQFARGFVPL